MTTNWTAIIFMSLSWVFAFDFYVTENSLLQWSFLGMALFFSVLCGQSQQKEKASFLTHLILLIPLVIALVMSEAAYRPALWFLIFGLTLQQSFFPNRRNRFPAKLSSSLLLMGAILTLQCPTFWLVSAWTARNPDLPYVVEPIHLLLKWLGADVTLTSDTLYLKTIQYTHKFTPTWNHLGLFPLLLIWLAGSFTLLLNKSKGFFSILPRFTLILIVYAIVRFVFLATVFITTMLFIKHESPEVHTHIFWLPEITAISFLPLIFVLARFISLKEENPIASSSGNVSSQTMMSSRAKSRDLSRDLQKILIPLSIIGLVLWNYFPDPGTQKSGKILIDEAHSQWERSDQAYTTEWYGAESGYNYYCIMDYMRHFYSVSTNLEGQLTEDLLSKHDILILKTPTSPYSTEELNAIENFVKKGGGLFLLGEHTNVFGSSVYLNSLMRRFGMAFRYDCVFDIERRWEEVYFPTRWGQHPIAQHSPYFMFAVSCSIDSFSWQARPILRGTGLWSLPIEYSTGNFYPPVYDHTYARYGAFDQMMAQTSGLGRVVAFSDSTVFSNFDAFTPGKSELFLSSIDWLNRSNRWQWIAQGGLILFFISTLLFLYSLRKRPPTLSSLTALAVVSQFSLYASLAACDFLNKEFYPSPPAHKAPQYVIYDLEHGDYELPIFGFTQDYPHAYETFYQWTLRLGYFPRVSFDLNDALKSDQPVVMITPTKKFSPKKLSSIQQFLEKGGSLLLLDSPENTNSSAPDLLNLFDLKLSSPTEGTHLVEPTYNALVAESQGGSQSIKGDGCLAIEGGIPLLLASSGETVLSYKKVGQGLLIAGGLAELFTDPTMGGSFHNSKIPDLKLRALFELEFTLLRSAVEKNPEKQFRLLGASYADIK